MCFEQPILQLALVESSSRSLLLFGPVPEEKRYVFFSSGKAGTFTWPTYIYLGLQDNIPALRSVTRYLSSSSKRLLVLLWKEGHCNIQLFVAILSNSKNKECLYHRIIKVGKDLSDHQAQLSTQHHHAC